jgi:hypothetical protein
MQFAGTTLQVPLLHPRSAAQPGSISRDGSLYVFYGPYPSANVLVLISALPSLPLMGRAGEG